jgi:hypothetical protein
MFIKIHGTVDWSSVMTELSLSHRGAKTVGGGWARLSFHWDTFDIKEWLKKNGQCKF